MAAEGHKTRRAALRALVGASALALPVISSIAAAALADPIFSAIERHLAAWRAVDALFTSIDVAGAVQNGREINQADWEAFERARALEDQLLDELRATPPATVAGMRAALEYLVIFQGGYLSNCVVPFLVTLLKSPLFAG